jgi:hypothetical protein
MQLICLLLSLLIHYMFRHYVAIIRCVVVNHYIALLNLKIL